MLAAAPSPAVRTGKRQLDEEEDPAACGSPAWGQDQLGALHLVKRHKVHALQHYSHQRASPGRCGLSAESGGAYAHPLYLPQATVSALRALFPEMDDKTVTAVLVECGNNIDAAIKRLTDLRLSSDDATVAAATAAAAASTQEPAGPSPPTHTADTADGAAAATQQQQASSAVASEGASGPQTGEQWIEYLISEMAAATGMADARLRAARVLQSFESFTKSGTAKEAEDLKAKLAAAMGENAILKRAVLLQNRRLAERSASEGEVAALRQALGQYQEQLRKLELHNYSLAMHLQQATGGAGGGGAVGHPPPRNPDVF